MTTKLTSDAIGLDVENDKNSIYLMPTFQLWLTEKVMQDMGTLPDASKSPLRLNRRAVEWPDPFQC